MVKFYENKFSYDYQWPAVTLAYFLRYPNPYSTHVLSTDTLSSHLDAQTGNLHITRLHLKRGKLPASVSRWLPKIKESYILEKSIVDVRNRRFYTETRNLEWESVLSVIESQVYTPSSDGDGEGGGDRTDVKTVVKFESRLGKSKASSSNTSSSSNNVTDKEVEEKRGFLRSWGTGSVQRSIELVGMSRMREGVARSREGMKVVLEQMRERGLVGVVKEQRQGGWKNVWNRGETRSRAHCVNNSGREDD